MCMSTNAFLARAYLNIPYVTNPPCNCGCRSCSASSLKLLLAEWLCLSSIHPYPISDVITCIYVFVSLQSFIFPVGYNVFSSSSNYASSVVSSEEFFIGFVLLPHSVCILFRLVSEHALKI